MNISLKRIVFAWTAVLAGLFWHGNAYAEWAPIDGRVTYNGEVLCAMVLANGQHRFTCDPQGEYQFSVPLDVNGQITLYAFSDGLAPYKRILTSAQAASFHIEMQLAAADAETIDLTTYFDAGIVTPGRAGISGSVRNGIGSPLCTMLLANGQHMFTCGASLGTYRLGVPIGPDGMVTLFGFCEGMPPTKRIFDTRTSDLDVDGYSLAEGDCDDLDNGIYPGAAEICGDGKDQDCNGGDAVCSGFVGTYAGRYSGDDYGTFSVDADSQNRVRGTAYSEYYHETYSLSGLVQSNGNVTMTAGTVDVGARFQGVIDSQGNIRGTWADQYGYSGSFSGTKR